MTHKEELKIKVLLNSKAYKRAMPDNDGYLMFLCWAKHAATGEVLMVCTTQEHSILAIPWTEHDTIDYSHVSSGTLITVVEDKTHASN